MEVVLQCPVLIFTMGMFSQSTPNGIVAPILIFIVGIIAVDCRLLITGQI